MVVALQRTATLLLSAHRLTAALENDGEHWAELGPTDLVGDLLRLATQRQAGDLKRGAGALLASMPPAAELNSQLLFDARSLVSLLVNHWQAGDRITLHTEDPARAIGIAGPILDPGEAWVLALLLGEDADGVALARTAPPAVERCAEAADFFATDRGDERSFLLVQLDSRKGGWFGGSALLSELQRLLDSGADAIAIARAVGICLTVEHGDGGVAVVDRPRIRGLVTW